MLNRTKNKKKKSFEKNKNKQTFWLFMAYEKRKQNKREKNKYM